MALSEKASPPGPPARTRSTTPGTGPLARLRGELGIPESVLERVRGLFLLACLSFLCLLLADLALGRSGAWQMRAAAATGIAFLAWHWARGYRRRRFHVVIEPLEFAALVLIGLAVSDVVALLAILYAGTAFRSLYGSGMRVLGIAVQYAAAYLIALAWGSGSPGLGSVAALIHLPAVSASALVCHVLGVLLRTHERLLARERILRDAAAALVSAVDADAVYDVGLSAADDLLVDAPTARLSLAAGSLASMRIVAAAGDRAEEIVGEEVRPRELPEPLAGALAGGRTVRAIDVDAADLQKALSYPAKAGSVSVLPLVVRGDLRAMVMVGDGEELDDDALDILESLGALMILALEAHGVRGELQVRRTERRFRSLVQNSSDVTLVVKADGTALYESPAARRVLGRGVGALPTSNLFELVHPEDRSGLERWLHELAATPDLELTTDVRLRHADGAWRVIEAAGRNALADPEVRGLVINYRDITARRHAEKQLLFQAFHDPLTKLPNRALFKDRLDHALSRRTAPGSVAVVFLDLDDFKSINDSFGHAVGDELLVAVADRLRGSVRAADTVARFGGDEFAILLEDLDSADAALAAADRIVRSLATPVMLRGKAISAHASLGIVLSETAQEPADRLLRNADVAMYRAKRAGKGRYEVFHDEMHQAVLDRLELKEDLRRALHKRELFLQYQPIVELKTGRLVALEALLRWRHPVRGVVAPLSFIPLAEETGLIVPIGRWVLKEACRQAAAWQRAYPADTPVGLSVNLSSRQLEHPDLPRHVANALSYSGLAPGSLTLEITESMLVADPHRIEVLEGLRDLGVRLAIDDFGTGYSSLSYLARFPIDMLKIDKSFIADVGSLGEGSVVPALMVELGEKLDLQLVAEGVEREEQATALRDLACRLGQGFYFARPLDASEVYAVLGRGSLDPAPTAASA